MDDDDFVSEGETEDAEHSTEPSLLAEGHDIASSDEAGEEDFYDGDDELPPILAPPSTGYLHTVDVNQPPPQLLPINMNEERALFSTDAAASSAERPEVVDLRYSDEEGSTTTDSDDELVDVDYYQNAPDGFKNALKKYAFASKKDQWIFNTRKLYQKQPTRIRRLLKMHKDLDGNPIEEPVEMLFEKIHAERERMRKAQNIKCEVDQDPDRDVGPASVIKFTVCDTDDKLTQVVYPGNVVNEEKAIVTLGGIGTLSKTFDQPNKKLLLKFRPSDPFSNGVHGQGRTTCGILLRVRRRKSLRTPESSSEKQETKKINLDALGNDPISPELVHDALFENQFRKAGRSDNSVTISGQVYNQQDLLLEDQVITEEENREEKTDKAWAMGNKSTDCNLKIPKILETEPDKSTKIIPLGVVHRTYDFNGICDFQYLPMTKKSDGSFVSIKDKVFPIFGSCDNPEKLVTKQVMSEDGKCVTFCLPPFMSRIDNPPRGLIEELIISEKCEKATTRAPPPDDSVFSNRTKRIIYTLSYNFQVDVTDKNIDVPSQPLGLALADIERRQIKKEWVENVRKKFEERAIWSKVALEYATKIPSQTLKYIIPHFAYFASNGPWRNTWIRFGVDPRKLPINVIYQSVDFRIPFIYRRFMDITSNGPPEAGHKFFPEHLPPKAQMFYQLCDIRLNEVKQLIVTLKQKAEAGTLEYDNRHGFLKDGSFEYFRYIMTYYLENLLLENGKIPETGTPEVTFSIPPGAIEPVQKMKAAPHRRIKQKRMRRSMRKVDRPSKGTKGKGKVAEKPVTATRSNLEKLEDLELNKLPMYSEGEEEFLDEDDDEEEDYINSIV